VVEVRKATKKIAAIVSSVLRTRCNQAIPHFMCGRPNATDSTESCKNGMLDEPYRGVWVQCLGWSVWTFSSKSVWRTQGPSWTNGLSNCESTAGSWALRSNRLQFVSAYAWSTMRVGWHDLDSTFSGTRRRIPANGRSGPHGRDMCKSSMLPVFRASVRRQDFSTEAVASRSDWRT